MSGETVAIAEAVAVALTKMPRSMIAGLPASELLEFSKYVLAQRLASGQDEDKARNAERYVWLRTKVGVDDRGVYLGIGHSKVAPDATDAAIDAAILSERAQGGAKT